MVIKSISSLVCGRLENIEERVFQTYLKSGSLSGLSIA